VDPTVGLDEVEKRQFFTLPRFELRTLRRPARSQSLFQLRYVGIKKIYALRTEVVQIAIKEVWVAVMFWLCIYEVFGANLSQDTGCYD
jgi:hypothetical protein